MNKSYRPPSATVGASSMLVIFIVLCIVIFSTLSLSTARSNLNTTEKIAVRTTEYYTANNIAEEKKQEIYDALYVLWYTDKETDSMDITSVVADMDYLSCNSDGVQDVLTYSVQINATALLQVELTLIDPSTTETNPTFFQVSTWKTVPTADWNGSDKLYVIGTNE